MCLTMPWGMEHTQDVHTKREPQSVSGSIEEDESDQKEGNFQKTRYVNRKKVFQESVQI